jgi:tRNA 2-thiouridine synthesizing protein A
MTTHTLDARGIRCPQPILKITTMMPSIAAGDVLEVTADCSTFENDVSKWCERMNKTLLAVTRDGDVVTAQIQF